MVQRDRVFAVEPDGLIEVGDGAGMLALVGQCASASVVRQRERRIELYRAVIVSDRPIVVPLQEIGVAAVVERARGERPTAAGGRQLPGGAEELPRLR